MTRRRAIRYLAGLFGVLCLGVVSVAMTPAATQALTNRMFNDSEPIYLGIGWHESFDGYSLRVAAYYDTWSSSRTIRLYGAGEDGAIIDNPGDGTGLQCRNTTPPSRAPSWNGTYATVKLDAGSGVALTYNISRSNFCSGDSTTTINSRTAPNSAKLRGNYQLPLGTPLRDPATGKFKVTITISLTSAARDGAGTATYNPNALFRLYAPGGLVGGIAGNHTATNPVNRNAIGSRVYRNTQGHYQHEFEFGSMCTMMTPSIQTVGLRDPDNYNVGGIPHATQGFGSTVGWDSLSFSVEERFNSTDPYVPIAKSRYINLVGGKIVTYGGVPAVTSTTVSDSSGQSDDTLVSFDMRKNGKYRMVVYNAYTRNFLQTYIPTDAIYNAIDCADVVGGDVYPTLSSPDTVAVIGKTVNATPIIRNANATYPADTRYTYRVWLDMAGDDAYNSGDDQLLANTASGPVVTVAANGSHDLSSAVDTDFTIDNAGYAQICYQLSVQPESPSKAATGHPNPATLCIPIGKKPHLQISGGDVIARGGNGTIHAPSVIVSGDRYGSWGEYGVFAQRNADIYSGASLMASTKPLISEKSRLTFANQAPSMGNFGNLGVGSLEAAIPNWPTVSVGSSINAADLQNKHINRATGNLSLGGTTAMSRSAVLEVSGVVTITGSIGYRDVPYTDLASMPQLIIIADEIRVNSSVTRIDAWLIARSGMITCGTNIGITPYFDGLRRGTCRNQLTINGPVQANKILLRRTAGAEGATTEARRIPAEVMNLRSDAYLWAYGQASGGNTIRTETIKELPPRF